MNTENDFIRIFPPWKGGTKVRGFPVWWLSIAGLLVEAFHKTNLAESHPLLLSE
jgi:hypothetical protein